MPEITFIQNEKVNKGDIFNATLEITNLKLHARNLYVYTLDM